MIPTFEEFGIDRLSVEERIELIGRIFDSIPAAELKSQPLLEWQRRLCEERMAETNEHPESRLSRSELFERLEAIGVSGEEASERVVSTFAAAVFGGTVGFLVGVSAGYVVAVTNPQDATIAWIGIPAMLGGTIGLFRGMRSAGRSTDPSQRS